MALPTNFVAKLAIIGLLELLDIHTTHDMCNIRCLIYFHYAGRCC